MNEPELLDAVRAGDLNKARLLCQQGADESEKYGPDFRNELLMLSVQEGYTDMVSYFLQRGANPNFSQERGFERETPLQLAAGRGDKDIASLLIQSGADVDAKNTAPSPLRIVVVAQVGLREVR